MEVGCYPTHYRKSTSPGYEPFMYNCISSLPHRELGVIISLVMSLYVHLHLFPHGELGFIISRRFVAPSCMLAEKRFIESATCWIWCSRWWSIPSYFARKTHLSTQSLCPDAVQLGLFSQRVKSATHHQIPFNPSPTSHFDSLRVLVYMAPVSGSSFSTIIPWQSLIIEHGVRGLIT